MIIFRSKNIFYTVHGYLNARERFLENKLNFCKNCNREKTDFQFLKIGEPPKKSFKKFQFHQEEKLKKSGEGEKKRAKLSQKFSSLPFFIFKIR